MYWLLWFLWHRSWKIYFIIQPNASQLLDIGHSIHENVFMININREIQTFDDLDVIKKNEYIIYLSVKY